MMWIQIGEGISTICTIAASTLFFYT